MPHSNELSCEHITDVATEDDGVVGVQKIAMLDKYEIVKYR